MIYRIRKGSSFKYPVNPVNPVNHSLTVGFLPQAIAFSFRFNCCANFAAT